VTKAGPPRDEVDALFRTLPPAYAGVARELRATIRAEAPSLTEVVRWNNPFWVGRAPVLCLQCFPDHVNLGVMRGAELAAEFPEIEGTGKSMRHVKIPTVDRARSTTVKRIIRAAARLDRETSSHDPLENRPR
jgi:hypothetical protein